MSFEEIAQYTDRRIQLMLRKIDMQTLVAAVYNLDEDQMRPLTRNMSVRAVDTLKKKIADTEPPSADETVAAQDRILQILKSVT